MAVHKVKTGLITFLIRCATVIIIARVKNIYICALQSVQLPKALSPSPSSLPLVVIPKVLMAKFSRFCLVPLATLVWTCPKNFELSVPRNETEKKVGIMKSFLKL